MRHDRNLQVKGGTCQFTWLIAGTRALERDGVKIEASKETLHDDNLRNDLLVMRQGTSCWHDGPSHFLSESGFGFGHGHLTEPVTVTRHHNGVCDTTPLINCFHGTC